jgi:glucose/arabinose dehydrogenase
MTDCRPSPPIKATVFTLACSLLLVGAAATPRAGAVGLKSQAVITSGLSLPIHAAAPPGNTTHLYIAEEEVVRLQRLDLTNNSRITVLDLPNVVAGNQTGLNGFAFHPNFATNGKIYLNVSGNAAGDIRILEFTRSTTDPNVFDPTTEREILTVSNPSFSHNGGWLEFGPHDDMLYLAMGDGGNVGPLTTRGILAQDLNSLQGKILRVDVDSDDFPADPERNYAIPETNPFADGGGAPEVFAWGLRHPFRNGFDSATGDLYIADVGSLHYEEINVLPGDSDGGQNYGWRPREGYFDNPTYPDASPPGAIDPIHAYEIGAAAAIIGGPVYRGSAIPWLQGSYIFTDFEKQQTFTFRYDDEEVTNFVERTQELTSSLGPWGGIASIAQDGAGELYLIDYLKGDIHKIVAAAPDDYGDFNQDLVVDAADYVVWRKGVGTTYVEADYNAWRTNFGAHVDGIGGAGGGFSPTTVPEPASALLLAIAALIVTASRRTSLFTQEQ